MIDQSEATIKQKIKETKKRSIYAQVNRFLIAEKMREEVKQEGIGLKIRKRPKKFKVKKRRVLQRSEIME